MSSSIYGLGPTEVKDPTELSRVYMTGDYVVGSFTENGTKVRKGRATGAREEVMSLAQKIAQHALGAGEGQLAKVREPDSPKKDKKGKKPIKGERVKQPTLKVDSFDDDEQTSVNEAMAATMATPKRIEKDYKTLSVVFSNKLGKIKVKVIDIFEEETSICLVFESEDDVVFEPQQGEVLEIVLYGNRKQNVMYPGFLYTWMDKTKKLMVLVKTDETE